jgi:hypothetical protein
LTILAETVLAARVFPGAAVDVFSDEEDDVLVATGFRAAVSAAAFDPDVTFAAVAFAGAAVAFAGAAVAFAGAAVAFAGAAFAGAAFAETVFDETVFDGAAFDGAAFTGAGSATFERVVFAVVALEDVLVLVAALELFCVALFALSLFIIFSTRGFRAGGLVAFDVAFRTTPAFSAMASPTYKTVHGGAPRTP